MQEVSFYQIDDLIVKSMAPLILKMLEDEKKAIIFCQDKAKIEEINNGLWQFSKTKFVPHATIHENDIDHKRQPILISDQENNINQADYLILTEESSLEFIKKFSRIFYFYDSMALDQAKKLKNKLSADFNIKSYKKIKQKWQNFEL